MLDTWDQRVRREGITVKKISFPVPPPSMDDLADRLIGAIGPKTRVLHFCHITNLTGQIFPVKKICDAARAKGVKTIVDGAHAFAHFPYKARGSRLRLLRHQPAQVAARADRDRVPLRAAREHRSALAADGHRRERARRTSASSRRSARIRRRTTTRSPRRSASTRGWASSGSPRACATCATAGRRGCRRPAASRSTRRWTRRSRARSARCRCSACRPARPSATLWDKWRIIATPIVHAEYEGIRVTPNVYTTLEEIDTFGDAMEIALGGVMNSWKSGNWEIWKSSHARFPNSHDFQIAKSTGSALPSAS